MSEAIAPALITAAATIAAGIILQIFLIVRKRLKGREVLYGELLDLLRHLAANDRAVESISKRPVLAATHHFQMLALPYDNISLSTSELRFLKASEISSLHRLYLSARNYNFVVEHMVENPNVRTSEVLLSLRHRGRGLFVKGAKIATAVFARRIKRFCKNQSNEALPRCVVHQGIGEFRFPFETSRDLSTDPISNCPMAVALWATGRATPRYIDSERRAVLIPFLSKLVFGNRR